MAGKNYYNFFFIYKAVGDFPTYNITMSENRLKRTQAKGWFCTWPKCPLLKEEVLKILDTRFSIKEYVICEEKHEDGSPHLHAFLKMKKKISFRSDLFDIEGYHGHYEVAKSWKAVIAYVSKEENYISNIDIKAAKEHKSKMCKEDLLRDVDELLDEGKITPMQVASWYKNSCVYKMLQKKRLPDELPEKKRHLWIYGPSNTGKTTCLRNQMREKGEDNFFQMPTNNDWIGYVDQYYLYFDEFKGQLSCQDLNRICDGGAKMNVKGGTVQLRYDVQVIILSNFSIEECYPKVSSVVLDSLRNRFIESRSDEN